VKELGEKMRRRQYKSKESLQNVDENREEKRKRREGGRREQKKKKKIKERA
jgi:hypothetical protein